MKNLIALAALFIVLFSSCKKDKDIIATETQIEDPVLIDDPVLTNDKDLRVSILDSENQPLADIKVDLYDGETALAENLITDEMGMLQYSLNTQVLSSENLLIAAHHESYLNGYKKVAISNTEDTEVEMRMIDEGQVPFDSSDPSILALSNSITLSGYIFDEDGNPGQATVAVVDDLPYMTFENSTISDANGYYELLIPENTDLLLLAISENDCSTVPFINQADTTLFYGFVPFDIIEASSTDIVMEDMITTSGSNNPDSATISLTVVDCDGNPAGNVEVSINGSYAFTDSNGQLSVTVDGLACNNAVYITLNPDGPAESLSATVTGDIDLGTLEVCQFTNTGTFEYSFDNGITTEVSNLVLIQQYENSLLIFSQDPNDDELWFGLILALDDQGYIIEATVGYGDLNGYGNGIEYYGEGDITNLMVTSTSVSGDFSSTLYEETTNDFYSDIQGSFNIEL